VASTVNVSGIRSLSSTTGSSVELCARFRTASSTARLRAVEKEREREGERERERERGGGKITSREDSRLVLRAIRYDRGPIISHCESLTRGIKTSTRTICGYIYRLVPFSRDMPGIKSFSNRIK